MLRRGGGDARRRWRVLRQQAALWQQAARCRDFARHVEEHCVVEPLKVASVQPLGQLDCGHRVRRLVEQRAELAPAGSR